MSAARPVPSAGTVGQSRRSIVVTGLAAGGAGAAWLTGLSVFARGVHPQMLVAGYGDWQVALIEER
ncbi:MAG TPA: hypothetical protein VD767_05410, partial [Thermomicrobiales bacterium]|nr:hypothetical protein [Thermomicrobiales bacterium]